jgi:hypothetical protein
MVPEFELHNVCGTRKLRNVIEAPRRQHARSGGRDRLRKARVARLLKQEESLLYFVWQDGGNCGVRLSDTSA